MGCSGEVHCSLPRQTTHCPPSSQNCPGRLQADLQPTGPPEVPPLVTPGPVVLPPEPLVWELPPVEAPVEPLFRPPTVPRAVDWPLFVLPGPGGLQPTAMDN